VSDDLRIDLALARTAGLPLRSANDASAPAVDIAQDPRTTDPLFSPLALLLARFLPRAGMPAPTPTPDEARLLHAYLQQRLVAVLRADGLDVLPTLRVAIDGDGALQLSPGPADPERVAAALRRDPDIARLLEVLQRAAMSDLPASSFPRKRESKDVAFMALEIGKDAGALADMQANDALARPAVASADARRAWPWRMSGGESGTDVRALPAIAPLFTAVAIALLLAWWLLG
jgi:hypothetical protein